METAKILIVEDDADINQLLMKILKKQGYEVTQAYSGTEAQLRIAGLTAGGNSPGCFDLLLLDLMLPGMSGEELLHSLREKSSVPVIILSAKSALEERVKLLNMGADDYLVKPFEMEEVIARVGSALRRSRQFAPAGQDMSTVNGETAEGNIGVLAYKELTVDTRAREVTLAGEPLSLTVHEYDILFLLMQNPNKVFSRESLYEAVWQGGYYGEDNTVNVHISNLRKKMLAVREEEYIKTVWGIGFKLV